MSLEENYEDLEDCAKYISELVEEEKNNMHFLSKALDYVREIEEQILVHRRKYFEPQKKKTKT